MRGAARVGALFPPQVRNWGLPAEIPLTPRAAPRVAREGALHSFDQAALGKDTPEAGALARQLKDALWDGQLDEVIATFTIHADRLGAAQPCDGPDHPRRVLANNVNYFETHRHHLDFSTFRRKGWTIGSGVTESAVKQFNKRVKGTEPFWSVPGVESILSLRALWLSQDGRWERFLRGSDRIGTPDHPIPRPPSLSRTHRRRVTPEHGEQRLSHGNVVSLGPSRVSS
jgi:hypothetical protein